MAIIAKYEFNQELYANLLPEFNSEFTNYTVTDVDNGNSTVYQISSDMWENGSISNSGTNYAGTDIRLIDYFEVEPGRTYQFSNNATVFTYNKDKVFKEKISVSNPLTITISYDVKYIRFHRPTADYGFNITLKSTTDRTIESSSYPTMMRFGQVWVDNNTDTANANRCNALLNVWQLDMRSMSGTSGESMFRKCYNLRAVGTTSVTNLTSLNSMFNDCKSLTYVNCENWDTKNICTMMQTFYGCSSLTTLNTSKWNTDSLIGINQLFYGCSSLTTLDVSKWNVSSVTSMSNTFDSCSSLTTLDVSKWDTGQVVNMNNIFYGCSSLTTLDVSKWNMKNVNSIGSMFQNCTSLTGVGNINNWNTSKIQSMPGMFWGCAEITKLELLNWDTSSVTTMDSCFRDCNKLETLLISTWDTSNVKNFGNMFRNCTSLTKLNISNFDMSKGTTTSNMLGGCPNLTVYINKNKFNDEVRTTASSATIFKEFDGQIVVQYTYKTLKDYPNMLPDFNSEFTDYNITDYVNGEYITRTITSETLPTYIRFKNAGCTSYTEIHEINTSKLISCDDMFNGCINLVTLNALSIPKTVTSLNRMLNGCIGLTSISTHLFDTTNVTNMTNMFNNCIALREVDMSNWNTSNLVNTSIMFQDCKALTTLDFTSFKNAKINTLYQMFQGCKELQTVNLSSLDTSRVTNFTAMFYGCESLKTLNLMDFSTQSAVSIATMFRDCKSLESLYISNFDISQVTDTNNFVRGCTSLKILDLSSFNTARVALSTDMFLDVPQQTIVYTNGNTWNIDTSSYNATFVTLGGRLLTTYKFNSQTHSDMLPTFNSGFGSGAYGVHDINAYRKTTVDPSTWTLGLIDTATGTETSNVNFVRSDFIEIVPTVKYQYYTNVDSFWYDIDKKYISYTANAYSATVPDNARYVRVCKASRPDTFTLTELNVITRALSVGTDYPTMIRFGENDKGSPTSRETALLEVLHCDTGSLTTMQSMFRFNTKLIRVCTEMFDTSNVTSMRSIFADCRQLKNINVSNWDTSQVNTMAYLFCNTVLESLDVSRWNTSEVRDISYMFANCEKLSEIDVSKWNTSSMTTMGDAFNNCSSLITLDVSKWDTSQSTGINGMFGKCRLLEELDVSMWDTSKVQTTYATFLDCKKLKSLDLQYWNVSNVEYMNLMFSGCSSLESLDISNWDVSRVKEAPNILSHCSKLIGFNAPNLKFTSCTSMASMFDNCTSLETLDLSGWDVSKVTTMDKMFASCTSLKNVNTKNWDTSSVITFNSMFATCESLTELDLSHFNTSSATNMYGVFSQCKKLEKVNLLNWDTKNVTDIGYMFNYCQSLKELDLRHFDTSNVLRMHWTFCMCQNLTKLDVSTWDTRKTVNFSNTFERCQSLTELDLSSFSTSQATVIDATFFECTNLETLDISNFHFGGVNQNINNKMFMNCTKLKRVAMIYCRASSFNTLINAFIGSKSPSITVYYHDANLSDLPSVSNVTYEYYDIQSVTLPYELNKLPNGVADYIDVVNGVYVQRVARITFDETTVSSAVKETLNTGSGEIIRFTLYPKTSFPTHPNNCSGICDKYGWTISDSGSVGKDLIRPKQETLFWLYWSKSEYSGAAMLQYIYDNPITVLYELKTPIYTPLTDEEKALLPLSAYSNGYIQLSSDELRPSKFEFRAKSSNRMQLDMLEAGHYYLNAPTGNVKLGDVDIDVSEMPCIVNVGNNNNKRLICGATFMEEKQIPITYGAWVDGSSGQLSVIDASQAERDAYSEYMPVTLGGSVTISHYSSRASRAAGIVIAQFNINKQLVKVESTNHIPNITYEAKSVIENDTHYIRFSVPMLKSEYDAGYKTVSVVLGGSENIKITLSKLPSHRIPTTFTQGMKSSVDFGYWQGSKEANCSALAPKTSGGTYGTQIVMPKHTEGLGIRLNRIESGSNIIEDEFDISTGKLTKRVGVSRITYEDCVDLTLSTDSGDNYYAYGTLDSIWVKNKFPNYNRGIFKASIKTDTSHRTTTPPPTEIEFFMSYIVGFNFKIIGGWTNKKLILLNELQKIGGFDVYYELETPEITYYDLSANSLSTMANTTFIETWKNTGHLFVQCKPAPLSYPTTLSPNTQYTVIHNRKNYGGSVKTPMINLGGTEVSATGSRTVVTTPSTLTHNELQFIGGENTVEQVMVLHGDWTKEGKTVDYFEGLQSSVIGNETLRNMVESIENTVLQTNGKSYIATNSDSIVKSAILSGKTLVNLHKLKNQSVLGVVLDGGINQHFGNDTSYSTWRMLDISMLKPNTEYGVFCWVLENTLSENHWDGHSYHSSDTVFNPSTELRFSAGETGLKFAKLTTISDFTGKKCGIRHLLNIDTPSSEYVKFRCVIVEYQEGMENWDIPYFEGMSSVKMPVLKTTGKNLFDGALRWGMYSFADGVFGSGAVGSNIANTNPIKVEPNMTIASNLKQPRVFEYGKNMDFIKYSVLHGNIQVSEKTEYINFHVGGYDMDSEIIFANSGTPPTYEPYKSNILTTSEDVELRGIGEVKDELNLLTGELTQRIEEVVLDGSGSWRIHTNNTNDYRTVFTIPRGEIPTGSLLACDKYLGSTKILDNEIYGYIYIGGSNLNVMEEPNMSLDTFKNKLNLNPITVQYQLETESIKTVDLTTLDQDNNEQESLCVYKDGHVHISSETITPLLTMSHDGGIEKGVHITTKTTSILTKDEFTFDGVYYEPSLTGYVVIDTSNIQFKNVVLESEDDNITVIPTDARLYSIDELQQFKGEMTFTKEFVRTGNGIYNTGMTLLEPLELRGIPHLGTYDIYNPITGELSKTIREIMLTADEVKALNISINSTNNSFGGCTIYFAITTDGVQHNANPHIPLVNTNYGAMKVDVATYGAGRLDLYFHYDSSYGTMTVDSFKEMITEDFIMVYRLATPQIIQVTPTSTYISTRPENGNIVAEDTQIHAEYLNYDNEQSIISPRMLGEGDEIRWEQGSQCYVYENAKEYIPLTDYDELFGANIQAQEYTQYVESVDGADIELGIPLKEKAVYQQSYVAYEDNIVYPTTRENLDETNGVEVDYICGATWQNPDDLSDIRHLGELREDGQYDVTIRRSGDDEIRLMEGVTNLSLNYNVLPPSEFELTFFNSGGVEVGKYGDTTHTLESCVRDSKLESGTVYGQTLVNLIDFKANSYQASGSAISREINTIKFKTNSSGKFNIGCTVNLKPSTKYCIKANIQSTNSVTFKVLDVKANQNKISETIPANGEYIGTFTASSNATTGQVTFYRGTTVGEETITGTVTLIEYIDGCENWLEHFEGINSTVVNGFSSCGKNLVYGGSTGTMEDKGLTWTYNNGIITLNGQKTEDDSYLYLHSNRLSIHPMIDGHYSISYKVLSGEVDTTECRLGNTYGQLTLSDYTNTHVLQLYGSEPSYYSDNKFFYGILPNKLEGCWIRMHKGAKFNNLKIQFQLERSSVHTAIEEPKIINYTLPTPITLRSIGDICDTFDVVSGTYTQKIHSIMLDDTWNWTSYTDDFDTMPNHVFIELTSDNNMSHPLNNSFALTSPTALTYLADIWDKPQYANDNHVVIGMSSVSKTKCQLLIPKSFLNGTPSFNSTKQYLKENPISVLYEFATPKTAKHTLIPSTTQTTQEPTFILPQPLRSVPNGICDRLYWDENKGHYCIEKRVGKIVLDDTLKNINYGGYSNTDYVEIYMPFTTGALIENIGYCEDSSFTMNPYNGVNYRNPVNYKAFAISTSKASLIVPRNEISEVIGETYTNNSNQLRTYLSLKPVTLLIPLATPEIIDLTHLDEKVELPTQPDIYPIGYKVVHEKVNPQLGLTIPYKQLNMPTQPVNLDFKMDIADYVLTWDDVKEARLYNIILNDELIATTKQPYWNSGEEMYGYILVEAQNEIGDSVSKELYIKTVPNAPAQLTVAHNPQTDYYDFEISFIDKSTIADYFTVQYRVDGGEWVINNIPNDQLQTGEKQLWSFSVYEINESIEVWATATNDVGTNDILPSAIYYMSPTPQWTYRINSKEVFMRWIDESPYDVKYKLRYSYLSNGAYQYAYFEGDTAEIGKLYEAVLPLAEDDEVTLALCIVSEKENLYCKPVKASKEKDPNIVPPLNFNYRWLARGLIEFNWQDQYDVDVEYEYVLETMKANEQSWTQVMETITSTDVAGTGTVYRISYQLEDLEQIRVKVRMKWAMNETEWSETLTTVFIPVEGNPPTYIRRTQTAEGLLVEWEAQAYIDSYHIYVVDNETGEILQHLETQDNSVIVDLDYSNSIELAIYEISRFSGGIESDSTDPMVFTPTMQRLDIEQRIYQPCSEEYPIETSTVQKATKQPYVIHDINYTPNVTSKHQLGVSVATPFQISYHPMAVDIHQAGSKYDATINAHIKTLDVRNEDAIRVMTFERTTDTYDMNFTVYTPSVASYPINLEVSKVRIVCLGDSLTSGHPYYWAETGTGMVEASYPYQLSRRLKNQYEVINSGYGSDTTDRCLARFDKDVLRYQPQYCIFQCGTNDLYWAMAESLNNQEALDMKMQVVRDNTMEVAKRCWDNGIIPIIGTLIPRTGATGIYKTALYEHNEWIINWCNEQSANGRDIFYVDFFNAGKDVVPPTPLEDPNNPGAING